MFSKMYMKAEVRRDDEIIMKGLVTTNETPYKLSLYMPSLLRTIFRDIHTFEMMVNHDPGQMFHVVSNDRRFKDFKISRTGRGNEKEVEFNGRKIGNHDYNLTGNFFKTKEKCHKKIITFL